MSEGARKGDEGERQDNLFKIIDGIVCQLDRTKKIFLILLVAITVIPPVTFVANHLVGNDQPPRDRGFNRDGGLGGALTFLLSPSDVPLWTSAVGIGIAIWQWFSLSWWTRRYRRYKQKRDEVEKRLGEGLD
jgi:hypothetical protein